MRIAIFSDIHGNIFALEAVLNAVQKDGAFDAIIAAGDLALGGSDPAGCVDRIRNAGILAVYGNTDEYLFAPEKMPGDELHRSKWDMLLNQVNWARPILGEARLDWLHSLPLDICFSPTSDPEDDLLVFHANPLNIEEMILPAPDEQRNLLGKVHQPDDDPELERLLGIVAAKTLAFGHFHHSSSRKWGSKTLVNVAACSLPILDKDPRARYTVFQWGGDEWQFTRRYLPYDWLQEVRALQASGMPDWEAYAETFPQS